MNREMLKLRMLPESIEKGCLTRLLEYIKGLPDGNTKEVQAQLFVSGVNQLSKIIV
jgi:hypothetical protein